MISCDIARGVCLFQRGGDGQPAKRCSQRRFVPGSRAGLAIGFGRRTPAVGGILGASVAPKLKARFNSGNILIGSIAVQSLATLLVGFANSATMMTLGWALAFACDPIFTSVFSSYRLSVTPDAIQGRTQSIYRMGGYGAEPLGTALGGLALGIVGARTEITVVAATVGLLALLLCATQRAIFKMAEARV